MSLDIYLTRKVYLSYDNGNTYEEKEENVYWVNITHNLTKMANKAGIYKAIWRPEEINAKKAKDIIKIIEKGLEDLRKKPEYFKQFNSSNGWGIYEDFDSFVEDYLKALKENPDAEIYVNR